MRSFRTTDERYKSFKRVSKNILQVLRFMQKAKNNWTSEFLMKYSKLPITATQQDFNQPKIITKTKSLPDIREGHLLFI